MKSLLRSVLALLVMGPLSVVMSQHAVSAAGVGCTNGTPVTSPLTVLINGAEVPATQPNVYGKYAVIVCNDTTNRSYNVLAGIRNVGVTNELDRFTSVDLETEFSVSFLPEAGTTPLVAEGHGNISRFLIDAKDSNRVTLVTKPLLYSDIYNNHCNNAGPAECVIAVKTTNGDRASADNIEIRVGVRYADATGRGGEGLSQLPGMYWSSAAYYFWLRTSCPTINGGPQEAVSVEVGGPHLKADGTQNYGNVTVFIPATSVTACFGAPPTVVKESLKIARSENGTVATGTTGTTTDVGLQYSVTADDTTGLTIVIPQVTFSKPTYSVATRTGKSLARTTKTFATMLRSAGLKKPSGGSFVVTSRTLKTCTAVLGKVYAYRTGTCKTVVVTYNKSGKKIASRTVSFRVR